MKQVKLGGHPIEAYSKDALTNYLGQYRVMKWILLALTVAASCFMAPRIIEEVNSTYGPSEFILVDIGVPLFFLMYTRFCYRSERKIKKELQRRAKTTDELAEMKNDAKESGKGLLIIMACIIVVALLVTIPIAWLLNFSGSEKETCKNCGRAVDLVEGYGYCEICYEGFVDWQENNWKDDNRGD